MVGLNSNDMEKAKDVQLALTQFEKLHLAHKREDGYYICEMCETDFPCERMMGFMVLQAIVSLSAMLPTGNVGAIMSRFGGGGKS